MTPEQREAWFTYHAPTEETAPKYAAIREAEIDCGSCISAILNGGALAAHEHVNARCRDFAEVIDACAPNSADKSAAIRCVRLARNAMNEAIVKAGQRGTGNEVIELCRHAERELRAARWQANSAIACNGV